VTEEEAQLELKLKVRKLVADRNVNNRETLGKPADESIKDAMLLSRLQSQWILFGSFASIALILNVMGNLNKLNGSILWSLLSFSAAALLSWFSISQWANYYYNRSTYYSEFYQHELMASQKWESALYTGADNYEMFDGAKYKKDMNNSLAWAQRLLACSLILFIIAMTIGLTNLNNEEQALPEVDRSVSKQLSPNEVIKDKENE